MQRRIRGALRLPKPGLIASLLFLFSGVATALVIAQAYLEHRNNLSLRELADARAAFESSLNASLNLTAALVAQLETADHFDEATFHRTAERLLGERSLIRNIAVMEGSLVIAVHPVEGNEAILGRDLLDLPGQQEPVRRALDTGAATLAGPVELVQGGVGLVHRVPIFRPIDAPLTIRLDPTETREAPEVDPPRARSADRRSYVWGLVSTPFRYEQLLAQPVIADWLSSGQVAIRGLNGRGEDGEVFHGDPAVFDHPRVQTASVQLPGGSWVLAAVPSLNPSPVAWLAILAPIVLGALLALTTWIRARSEAAHQGQIAASEARHRLLAEQLPEVVFLTDEAGRVQYLNSAWTRRTGLATAPFIGQPWPNLIDPRDRQATQRAYVDLGRGLRGFEHEVRIVEVPHRQADPTQPGAKSLPLIDLNTVDTSDMTWSLLRIVPLAKGDLDTSDAARRQTSDSVSITPRWSGRHELIGVIIETNAQKHRQERAEYAAQHDALTGLGNRVRLESGFSELSRLPRHQLALIYIDLDRFKPINDRLGHDAGDDVLRIVAQRIRQSLRPGDIAVRLGGDEFAALLAFPTSDPAADMALDDVAQRLTATIEQPIEVMGEQVSVGASHGVAWYPRDGVDLVLLRRVADTEMYRRKALRRQRA